MLLPTQRIVDGFTASANAVSGALDRWNVSVWAVVGGSIAVTVVVRRLRRWRRLRHIPGPFWASISDFWIIKQTWQGNIFAGLGKVCKEYGPLARIGPNYVVCGDPAEVRRIWGVRSAFDRDIWYKGFQLDPPRDSTISMLDPEVHTAIRMKLAHGYGGKSIEGLHESIDVGIARFIQLLEEKYVSTDADYRPVDLAPKVQFMALDIISTIAFGEPFGFLEADADKFEYIGQTTEAFPTMLMIGMIPWLIGFLQSSVMAPFRPSEKNTNGLGPLVKIARSVVGKRYGPDKIERKDMLGSFVSNGLTQYEAESESLVQILAGSDTTASALRTLLFHVITSPTVCRRLQSEIDEGIASGTISSPVTDGEARRLPFLQACIRESLRIWPPVSGILPRVAKTDQEVCGVRIPAGTTVCWSAWATLHNEQLFGADADMYRPARWLQADKDKLMAMDNAIDLCFGHGRWGCLGRPIAMIELNKMVVELLRRYDFTVVNPAGPIKTAFYGVLFLSNFNVRITRRSEAEA